MTRLLERLGLVEIAIREWQLGHYGLVTAVEFGSELRVQS